MMAGWKHFASLHKKRDRYEQGRFLVEGTRLCREALSSDWVVEGAFLGASFAAKEDGILFLETFNQRGIVHSIIPDRSIQRLAETSNPRGIVLVMKMPPLSDSIPERTPFVLALDGVRDPGNLGTIIRVADWYGVSEIRLSGDCVDPYNGKVVRGSMGSLFHVAIRQCSNLSAALLNLREQGFSIWTTALESKHYLASSTVPGPLVLVLGGETSGISPEVQAIAERSIRIQGYGRAESLNVAIAGAVCLERLIPQVHAIVKR